MNKKAYLWLLLKVFLFGLVSIFGVLAGQRVAPSFFRFAIILFVWAAEMVLIHWIVEIFHHRFMRKHFIEERSYKQLLGVRVRRILGIVSLIPIPVFLFMLALMPEQRLWLLPIGVMAGSITMVTAGFSISRKKPYIGWIGFAMALVMYLLVFIGYITSL